MGSVSNFLRRAVSPSALFKMAFKIGLASCFSKSPCLNDFLEGGCGKRTDSQFDRIVVLCITQLLRNTNVAGRNRSNWSKCIIQNELSAICVFILWLFSFVDKLAP